MVSMDNALDLEDLARRYDTQVLREYLLEQGETRAAARYAARTAAAAESERRPPLLEVYDLRPRCLARLNGFLVLNVVVYWSIAAYCTYEYYLRVLEDGARALPQLEVSLLVFFMLGTQSTLEFAAAVCLTQPARVSDVRNGLHARDFGAWFAGLGARTAIALDALCLPLMWRGSSLLFLLSSSTFSFAIGIFVFLVQLRSLLGIYCSSDHFSYDKPDLFFKGRDAFATAESAEGARIAARPSARMLERLAERGAERSGEQDLVGDDDEALDVATVDRPPPFGAIKAANLAHMSDFAMLHAVLVRCYVPITSQETQEFTVSASSFSRCFCEDVVQCSLKFFFLMDCEFNGLVFFSLLVSVVQAVGTCVYSTTSAMDVRMDDEGFANDG